jgi:oxygen-dependent protoporphyrinogen oxidase
MIGTLDKTRREATIVGAGIAGLLAAYALDRAGYRATLLEERERAGGLIQTVRTDYGIAERAAHSLLVTPAVAALCRDLGVELTDVRRDSRSRFILRDGKLRKFPLSVGEAAGALSRAAFARAGNHADALDLESWGRKHLGGAAVEYLLTPFVRGIYGAEPAGLGVAAAFPELAVAEGRTLLGAMLRKALRGSSTNGATEKSFSEEKRSLPGDTLAKANGNKRAKERKRMVAPLHGMGDLVSRLEGRLEERLGERFVRGARVEEIPRAPNLVITAPAYAAAELLEAEAPDLSLELREVQYTPIVTATAFVSRDAFVRPVSGVGVLVPPGERRACLGILFNSSAFEGRVRDESRHASFTVLFGGASQPEWVTAPGEEIERAVKQELRDLLGIRGGLLRLVVSHWRRAIPQYSTRLPRVWRTARETWCARPGRVLFGNYTGQVSLRGMIETALSFN